VLLLVSRVEPQVLCQLQLLRLLLLLLLLLLLPLQPP
jgi:hypothetical protein